MTVYKFERNGDRAIPVYTEISNYLTGGKKFTLLLGSDTNMLSYSISNSGLPVPNKIKTDVGIAILINELPICVFGRHEISCSRPIDMDQHSNQEL